MLDPGRVVLVEVRDRLEECAALGVIEEPRRQTLRGLRKSDEDVFREGLARLFGVILLGGLELDDSLLCATGRHACAPVIAEGVPMCPLTDQGEGTRSHDALRTRAMNSYRIARPVIVSALAVLTGCAAKVDRIVIDRVVERALRLPDVDQACAIGESMNSPLASVTSDKRPPRQALLISSSRPRSAMRPTPRPMNWRLRRP